MRVIVLIMLITCMVPLGRLFCVGCHMHGHTLLSFPGPIWLEWALLA